MIALFEAYRSGLLRPRYWLSNLTAGVIVGIVALPLAMAFAIASGVAPEQGIYTAIIAGLVVGLFGGSRVQIAGPTGAFVIILAHITAQYGISGLQIATLMAGAILLLMGIAKLGTIIKFIPDPVIVGFTSGIGVIIFVGEWKDFFGLPLQLPLDALFYQKIWLLLQNLPLLNIPTTSLAILSLALILITPRLSKRIPGPLVALVVVTTLQALFQFKGVSTIGSVFGEIPSHLPKIHFPIFTLAEGINLIGPAFTIALLGAIESLLSATVADGMTHTRHNSNQELIGQGLANLITPLFGGFAATGAIARTVTNIRNGGNSPLAAIVHSFVLILILVLCAPLASSIPLCTLASILFVVAYNMSDLPHFIRTIKYAPRYDTIILFVTFSLTVLTDLVIAVNVGVILSMLFFIRRMYQSVTVEMQPSSHFLKEFEDKGIINWSDDILVYTIQGPFFFGAAEKIEQALLTTHTDPKIIIFRLKEVPFIDMTGLETFYSLMKQFRRRDIKIYICEANTRITRKLKNINALQLIESNQVFSHFSDVLKKLSTNKKEKI